MSFVTRMVLITVSLVMAATLGGGAAAYFVATDIVEKEIQFAGQSLAHSLSGSIVTIINKPGSEGELQVILNKMLEVDEDERIEDAVVLSKKLDVLAAKDPSQVGLVYSQYGGIRSIESVQVVRVPGFGTRIAAPVQWGRQKRHTLGYVILSLSEQAFTSARNRIFLSFAALFLLAIVATVLATRFALGRVLRSVVRLGEAAREYADGNLDYTLPSPKSGDEVAVATRSFLAMREAQGIFARFSNPALVQEIVAGRAPDQPQEVKLTVGFGDGVGFTQWSGAHTAAEISELLSDYFTLFGHLVVKHEGIVEKFIGDAMMAYYGLHDEVGAQGTAQEAIRAHMYGQHAVAIANRAFRKYHRRVVLQFRFGIATGKCVVGPMGARGIKLDYTIIGDTVNLASRLEGVASVGGLCIDNFTYLNADGEEFLEVRGPVREAIKGFADPVPVFHVTGFRSEEETVRMRESLRELFHTPEVLEVLALNPQQRDEFHRDTDVHLRESPLHLP